MNYTDVPFADFSVEVDCQIFDVSRHALSSRSGLLKAIFEESKTQVDASDAIQSAWESALTAAGVSELSFVVLLEALYTGLDTGAVPKVVLDYFMTSLTRTSVLVDQRIQSQGVMYRVIHCLPTSYAKGVTLDTLRILSTAERLTPEPMTLFRQLLDECPTKNGIAVGFCSTGELEQFLVSVGSISETIQINTSTG